MTTEMTTQIREQEFALQQRKAKLYASSTMVPKEYQNNLPNCVIAQNMAERMGADILMVMQNLYVVHGKPGWSSQFLISCFNSCGRFSSIKYRLTGEGDDWGCVAYATELSTGEEVSGPRVTIRMAKEEGWHGKSGSKWKTMPELMLRYRAATLLVRCTAPEIGMGLQTSDEIHDTVDGRVTRRESVGIDATEMAAMLAAPAGDEAEPEAVAATALFESAPDAASE